MSSPLDPEGVRTSSQLNDERGEASSPETATSICLGITVRMRARILADLRQPLRLESEDNMISPKYLLTEPGIGYRFADSIEQVLVIPSTSDAMRD